MNILNGKKVTLRPIRFSDSDMLCLWKNDEKLYMYLGGGFQPVSEDQYSKWVESMVDQTGTTRRFIVETRDGSVIGMVGLYDINWIHRTCEIGGFIGNLKFQGKGYGYESCSILESFAANYLNIRKIRLKVVSDNFRACSFWYKLGYECVGKLSKERFINGVYCDVSIMEKFLQN